MANAHTYGVPETTNGLGKVLIVEDDFDIRDLLQQYLEDSGYAVIVAANGLEGLARLRENGRDLGVILLDRNMDAMDGALFLDAVDADRELSDSKVPVVMMSAAGEVQDERAMSFLRKPFDLSELLEVVEHFVRTNAGPAGVR